MSTTSNFKSCLSQLIVAFWAAAFPCGGAFAETPSANSQPRIDFESYGEGYVDGQEMWRSLQDQPATAWEVVADPVRPGKALRGAPEERYQGVLIAFDEVHPQEPLDFSESLVRFSFDYRADDGVCGWYVQRFSVGGRYESAASFQPRSAEINAWRYWDGATEHIAVDETGKPFDFSGRGWVTISGELDYKQKKYRLSVGGVAQKGSGSDGWISFRNPEKEDDLGMFFSAYVDNIRKPVFLDNISMTIVPRE